MNDAEIEADCRARIEALFASVHPVQSDGALVTYTNYVGSPAYEAHVVFANGAEKPQFAPVARMPDNVAQATANALSRRWPEHRQMILVWRCLPTMEHEAAHGASHRYGVPAAPAIDYLRVRLCALPDTATNILVLSKDRP